ncbi:MAG: zinc ribbon domain-containing protein, partial [Deltaproteobacteria bacterium]|nr:zinc ribbon domain-containing protein [Deltaproteobacteria bacterium]
LLLVGFVLLAIFWTKTVAITTTGHTWKREIQIEDFQPRDKDEWCDTMPSDAYSVTRSQEIRSYKDVPDGETCSTQRVDRGDGTYTEKQVCETKYRKEPVYDDKCRFTVDRWEYARSVIAEGKSLAEEPVWPVVDIKPHKKKKKFGAEREGEKIETYSVHFQDTEGETNSCDFAQAKWAGIDVGSQWAAEASVITGLLDCDSLRPPGQE